MSESRPLQTLMRVTTTIRPGTVTQLYPGAQCSRTANRTEAGHLLGHRGTLSSPHPRGHDGHQTCHRSQRADHASTRHMHGTSMKIKAQLMPRFPEFMEVLLTISH